MLFSTAIGIVSAIVGAGFASGREIMHFFSRYGLFSWILAVLAAALMGWMIKRLMDSGAEKGEFFPEGRFQKAQRWLLFLVYGAIGGAMTAAAGELAALTLPFVHARTIGGLLTLTACVFASRKPLVILSKIGKILLPLLLMAFFLCSRIPSNEAEQGSVSISKGLLAMLQLPGYCGLNVMLSAGVIREAGRECAAVEKKRISILVTILIGALLFFGNHAMLPHAFDLQNAALPVVMLLKAYGKAGFYLSAAVLYLAVFSTLIAILRGMRCLNGNSGPGAGLLCAAASLLGFSEIVGAAYPILGWLGVFLIFGNIFLKSGTKCFASSSIGRKSNKEEGNQ